MFFLHKTEVFDADELERNAKHITASIEVQEKCQMLHKCYKSDLKNKYV